MSLKNQLIQLNDRLYIMRGQLSGSEVIEINKQINFIKKEMRGN